jgi:hypothetical protein
MEKKTIRNTENLDNPKIDPKMYDKYSHGHPEKLSKCSLANT